MSQWPRGNRTFLSGLFEDNVLADANQAFQKLIAINLELSSGCGTLDVRPVNCFRASLYAAYDSEYVAILWLRRQVPQVQGSLMFRLI
ncbi:hypothetical protein SAMN05192564_106289 [Paraburkholderia sartisoli]|uniref:Uncharacterized protein n=1 Tax=Paraburkholderia sartisoli TaxID=83784 RepID=A0A1H4GRW5_9BURK|nr:hypothetical protein SAMN05192564_106289 [Paraburkholderia sartisoli]